VLPDTPVPPNPPLVPPAPLPEPPTPPPGSASTEQPMSAAEKIGNNQLKRAEENMINFASLAAAAAKNTRKS
jgi:hypothetical protein